MITSYLQVLNLNCNIIGSVLIAAWTLIRIESQAVETNVPQFVLVVGISAVVASGFGVHGSLTFNRFALHMFNKLVFCLILVNCWATIYVYLKLDDFKAGFVEFVTRIFGSPLFNFIQYFLRCCGVFSHRDYLNRGSYPLSCCPPGNVCCRDDRVYHQSCNFAAENFFDSACGPAFIFFIFKTSFEGVALFFSYHVVRYHLETSRPVRQPFAFLMTMLELDQTTTRASLPT